MVDADVERFVDDDPRDGLLTAGLRHRAVVRDVVAGGWQQLVHRHVAYRRLLTCEHTTATALCTQPLD